MKTRVLVLNGQKLIQGEQGGEWTTQKVEKAGPLKPGIYNLYLSSQADKAQSYEGVVVHLDRDLFYQQVGKSVIRHAIVDVSRPPDLGANIKIVYQGPRATVTRARSGTRAN